MGPNEKLREAAELRRHAEKMLRLASLLENEVAENLDAEGGTISFPKIRAKGGPPDVELTAMARRRYNERQRRSRYFDAELFGEPVWDIILDLFYNQMIGRTVSITSACLAAAVPNTTALRYIDIIEHAGLAERYADTKDARRSFLHLTSEGLGQLRAYLSDIYDPSNMANDVQAALQHRKFALDTERN